MKAPQFELEDLKTGRVYKLSQLIGKPILLTFWVSWCPDCQTDLPNKVAFYNNIKEDTLHFLSINVTGREVRPEDGVSFIQKHPLSFPVLADKGRDTYDKYGCTSVPSTILINKKGDIVATFGDRDPFSSVLQALGTLLDD